MPRPPAPRPGAPWRADLRRSRRLFADFRVEQTDPARFYGALAADSVGQLSTYLDLDGATMLVLLVVPIVAPSVSIGVLEETPE